MWETQSSAFPNSICVLQPGDTWRSVVTSRQDPAARAALLLESATFPLKSLISVSTNGSWFMKRVFRIIHGSFSMAKLIIYIYICIRSQKKLIVQGMLWTIHWSIYSLHGQLPVVRLTTQLKYWRGKAVRPLIQAQSSMMQHAMVFRNGLVPCSAVVASNKCAM